MSNNKQTAIVFVAAIFKWDIDCEVEDTDEYLKKLAEQYTQETCRDVPEMVVISIIRDVGKTSQ